ncbi:hypothetical protein K432DRAFT_389463 [Lepidopterella palustris CBS 459.81]|uniref:Uncharacterized protein n=1 Tax=Lepidopterella palustris CBS 459.81 TaxID=1314670 RepID=A0A8E2EJ23_9PEZI|nr:hypothetical protein K432DRAFT_389463 [Lepidopterella palustris CBS 459.81]
MTWNSESTKSSNSSASSERFGLDQEDKSGILVYRYRSGSSGLEVSSQHDLCKSLDTDPDLPHLRVAKKKIPRGDSRVEVKTEDLFPEEDRKKYSKYPTLKASLANVGLPSSAYWKRLFFNSFPELYIVSRSISPSPLSSTNNSPESSQHVSPQSTFPPHHGAQKDQINAQDHS